jgi:glycolate oxidase iron-sulfur subunit
MNTLFADTARHTVAVLSRLRFEVVIPRGVVCCGAPQMTLGERDLARGMARRNLGCFEGLDLVVTDCAACGSELKHYSEFLGDPRAADFSARVRDLSEVVEPLLPEGLGLEGSATYHAPCHLAHGQGTCGPPKALLRRLYADYRELPEHDRCCGSAGVYWATHPAISDHALARKLAALRSTGAETVVTANPGCVLQLLAGRAGEDRWTVAHLSDVLYQALTADRNAPDRAPESTDPQEAGLAREDAPPEEAAA